MVVEVCVRALFWHCWGWMVKFFCGWFGFVDIYFLQEPNFLLAVAKISGR
jgi:hypothetical protein